VSTPAEKGAILLVEDAMDEILHMRTLIEQAGPYQVTSVQDGVKGLELFLAGGWALARIDLQLPGLDGIELIKRGKEGRPEIPIVAVTGSTSPLMIDGAFRAGAEYVLSKPIDRDELLRKVREFVTVGGEVAATSGGTPTRPEPGEAGPAAATAGAPSTSHVPTVLAVGARPGDVEMGCGGLLFKHRAEGHQVVVLTLAGGGDPNSDLAAAVRAAGILGAQLTSIGNENEDALDLEEATGLLKSVIAESSPGMVYLPTAAAGAASAVESHRITLAAGEAVPNVLAYQCPSATLAFHPHLFVGVGPFIARKNEMLACYSELGLANVGPELASATARYWGRFKDPEQVEPLEVIRRGGA
jgi:CheY-like chemotaxis protein